MTSEGKILTGLIFILVMGLLMAGLANNAKNAAAIDQCDRFMAHSMSKQFVRKRLKSPSTAVFPTRAVNVQELGGCKFRVVSFVDAENSFGAKLRTSYTAEVRNIPGTDQWELTSLAMR